MLSIPRKPGWQVVAFESVCNFQNGYAFKNTDYDENVEEFYVVFKIGNIKKGGGLKESSSDSIISKDKAQKLTRFLLKKNDVLIAMTDMKASMVLLGHTAFLKVSDKFILNQRVGRIAVKSDDILNPRFFYYYSNSAPYINYLRGHANSGVQVNLSTEAIKNSPVVLPPIGQQRRIARILSAYDDLIENNTRRIQILEEMAQRIYEEWFVRFRFSGHEKVKMIESELGLIPDRWEPKNVTQMIEFDPRTTVPRDGMKPFVPMTSLAENSMLITKIECRAGNSGSKFKNGDTLFARITPCLENGKTGFVDFLPDDNPVAFGSTEYIVLRSKTVTPEFVYLTARSTRFRQHAIKSMSGATGRQRVRVDSFNEFQLVQPDKDALSKFSEVMSPTFKAISCLSKKNANLRETRDLLLPKLISGEIDVSNFP